MSDSAKWTQEEEATAQQLRDQGWSYKEISTRLKRSEAAICQHLAASREVWARPRLIRTAFNFVEGEIYTISQSNFCSSNLYFLPASFYFLEKIWKPNRLSLYRFLSVKGRYCICFTFPQILGSYIIARKEQKGGIDGEHIQREIKRRSQKARIYTRKTC